MRRQLITASRVTVVLTVLLGLLYPLAVWAVGQTAFSDRADGSFVTDAHGQVVGSSLIGQPFVDTEGKPDPRYFQPRPSAAGDGYDAMASAGSNLGPGNEELLAAIEERSAAYRAFNGLDRGTAVPVDAVTASASGLDPHISIANARMQAQRVATARGLPAEQVDAIVDSHTEGRQWGFLGEKRVNVLELNLALDALEEQD